MGFPVVATYRMLSIEAVFSTVTQCMPLIATPPPHPKIILTREKLARVIIDALVRAVRAELPIFAFLFLGIVVEKHYVSRVTVFNNVLALNMSLLSVGQAPRLLVWYGDIGLILGAYGMLAYLLNVRTWWGYNAPAFFAYASLPVAAVVLASPGDWWILLLIGGLLNVVVA